MKHDHAALSTYLSAPPSEEAVSQSRRAALVRRLLSPRRTEQLRSLATDAGAPIARRKLETAARAGPMRLHLGSGFLPKEGWVNIDRMGAPADVHWNLARGLPFAEGSVDAIFHEHLMEHLSLRAGWELLAECHRVLRPDGVLRIGVPDAGLCLRSYAGTDDPDWARSAPQPMLAVQSLFYDHEHRAMYDADLLVAELRAAGFGDVRACEPNETRIEPSPDSPERAGGTLYVEGTKQAELLS